MAVPPSAFPENENPTNISVSLGDQWSDSLKDHVAKNIVVSFHEQFAQNQNHHQTLFLQVLGVLVTVLAGLGYLYVHVDSPKAEFAVDIRTLYWFLILSMCLLSMSIAMVCNMAYCFRRDQLVASNIRIKSGVMRNSNTKSGTDLYYFPQAFNPVEKSDSFDWMPGFHQIFFVSLIAVKSVLIASVLFHPQHPVCCICCGLCCINLFIVLAVATIVFDFILMKRFHGKWQNRREKIIMELSL